MATVIHTNSLQLTGRQRSIVVLTGEGKLDAGTILFCDPATGKYVAPTAGYANVGTPVILLEDIDATAADVPCTAGIAGDFDINQVIIPLVGADFDDPVPLGDADAGASLVIFSPELRDFLRMFGINLLSTQNIEV